LNVILQVVPNVPGGVDGVGDYALTLAAKLRDSTGYTTLFATPHLSAATSVRGFEVRPLEELTKSRQADRVILHYVNYGYQKRGVPFGLLSSLRRMRRARLLTVFHELYGSGPPWGSAFWLQSLQIHLAKSIARLSDECIVSNETFETDLRRLVPAAKIRLHPTPSGLEEPRLTNEQITDRDPHQWAIVGGTVLAERSLRSFVRVSRSIPESIAPRALFVLGGNESSTIRSLLNEIKVKSDYRPRVASAEASEILRRCSYMWIDYFHRPDVDSSVALKSSAFAAACAHAIIPVFPHGGTQISIAGDALPGPFFVRPSDANVPHANDRPKIATDIYNWYGRHSSSDELVRGVELALGLKP
jgi:hypothetical protein